MKEKSQEEVRRMLNGIREFAWIPFWSRWTGWFWLRHYWIFYDGEKQNNGSVFIWNSAPDTYSPMVAAVYLNDTDALAHKLKMKIQY